MSLSHAWSVKCGSIALFAQSTCLLFAHQPTAFVDTSRRSWCFGWCCVIELLHRPHVSQIDRRFASVVLWHVYWDERLPVVSVDVCDVVARFARIPFYCKKSDSTTVLSAGSACIIAAVCLHSIPPSNHCTVALFQFRTHTSFYHLCFFLSFRHSDINYNECPSLYYCVGLLHHFSLAILKWALIFPQSTFLSPRRLYLSDISDLWFIRFSLLPSLCFYTFPYFSLSPSDCSLNPPIYQLIAPPTVRRSVS